MQTDAKELRKFSITLFIALGILGLFLLWRKGGVGFVPLGFAFLLLLLGMKRPSLLTPFYKGWMTLSLLLGYIMSHLVLMILYYLLMTPIGLVMRILQKDLLGRQFDKKAKTYWVKRSQESLRDQYEKMF